MHSIAIRAEASSASAICPWDEPNARRKSDAKTPESVSGKIGDRNHKRLLARRAPPWRARTSRRLIRSPRWRARSAPEEAQTISAIADKRAELFAPVELASEIEALKAQLAAVVGRPPSPTPIRRPFAIT